MKTYPDRLRRKMIHETEQFLQQNLSQTDQRPAAERPSPPPPEPHPQFRKMMLTIVDGRESLSTRRGEVCAPLFTKPSDAIASADYRRRDLFRPADSSAA